MSQQGYFTLPKNISFGVTAFSNAALTQTVNVLVDGKSVATFSGSGTGDHLLGTKTLNSGSGNVQISVSANGKPSDVVSSQVLLGNAVNFGLLGSEDSTDKDYNDAVAILNWPLN